MGYVACRLKLCEAIIHWHSVRNIIFPNQSLETWMEDNLAVVKNLVKPFFIFIAVTYILNA